MNFQIFDKANPKNTPSYIYAGFAPLLVWHFCFWFSPNAMPFAELLSANVTKAWLVYLVVSVISFVILALLDIKSNIRHCHKQAIVVFSLLGVCSLLSSYGFAGDLFTIQIYVLPAILGFLEAACLVLWCEHYSSRNTQDTASQAILAATSIGFVLLIITRLLPSIIAPLFISALPLASLVFILHYDKTISFELPKPMPSEIRTEATKNISIISTAAFLASITAFFILAIIPTEELMFGPWTYYYGIAAGTFLMALYAFCTFRIAQNKNPFLFFYWIIVLLIIACTLFTGLPSAFDGIAFLVTATIYSGLELILIIYVTYIIQKGCIKPVVALAISIGLFRLGVFIGDSIALYYESFTTYPEALISATASILLCFIALILFPVIQQGTYIQKFSTNEDIQQENTIPKACQDTAREFGLSDREEEIMELLASGYAVDNIAEKLVISPYTVRSHIRNIYSKMGVHKRSELTGYILDQIHVSQDSQ